MSGESEAFSAFALITRIVFYSIPSLLLVWYFLLKTKSLGEWGITLPKKKDLVAAALSFPALLLIGLTISLVSAFVRGEPATTVFSLPNSVLTWVLLVISFLTSAYLEESYFRFYLLSKRTEMGLGPHGAVLFSSLLFALCHTYDGPWGFLNAALSGVVLAFIFLRFQSLHGISFAHALYNIVAYSLAAIPAA